MHKFEKSVADYACGQLNLMLQRVEQHQSEHDGQLPVAFILHAASSRALNDDHYKRYGVAHGMQFLGVPIVLCMCDKMPETPTQRCLPLDLMSCADGKTELL